MGKKKPYRFLYILEKKRDIFKLIPLLPLLAVIIVYGILFYIGIKIDDTFIHKKKYSIG